MLEIEDLHYAIADQEILHGITARFEPCRIHGIVGPNGSGKSTLLKNICRIWEPRQGRIRIDGKDYRTLSRRHLSRTLTLVPQNTSIGFPISVHDLVAMGRNPHLGRFQPMRKRDREIIARSMAQTRTTPLQDRIVNELSGGECQLAVIARALTTEAPLILLDEPTSELDIKHALTIMDLLVRLKESGKTILVSIHDLNLARRYCDTVSILAHGELYFAGTATQALSREHIREVFQVDVTEHRADGRSFLYFHEDGETETRP